MKANWRRPASKAEKERIRGEVGKELRRQSGDLTRRTFKLFCLALNREYGFGQQRLLKVTQTVNDLALNRETDEVFWKHVDDRMEQLGLMFQREDYEEMDG